jgi:hypothetical protein
MANKSFCDYCGIEIECDQNRHHFPNYMGNISCDKCFVRYKKIREKYNIKFNELEKEMIKELKGISGEEKKKGFLERLFKK